MAVHEVEAAGREALELASALLQRNRQATPEAGLWEAADAQWWWRRPRESDGVAKAFWVDDDGPVAGVMLTAWAQSWQCDPVLVPGVAGPDAEVVWDRALDLARRHAPGAFDVPVDDDDEVFTALARRSGLTADTTYHDGTAWMRSEDRPAVPTVADGFEIVDRSAQGDEPHPMRQRNGEQVAERLAECSLYEPALDLAVRTSDGRLAGYALFWFDPVTAVGLVEPVRVEDEFHRRGLARVLVSTGLDRLATRGARRMKVSYGSPAAEALYTGLGFRPTSTTSWFRGGAAVSPGTAP